MIRIIGISNTSVPPAINTAKLFEAICDFSLKSTGTIGTGTTDTFVNHPVA
jgi:hypothetical protein